MTTYLRVIPCHDYESQQFTLFSGTIADVMEDRKYWKKTHNLKARYFELDEI